MLLESVIQRVVTGILVGSIYGLLCTGLGMIFGVIRVINFAQGEFMMLGMYATFFVSGAAGATALFGPIAGIYVAVCRCRDETPQKCRLKIPQFT